MNAYRHLALVALGAVVLTATACDYNIVDPEVDKEPSITYVGTYPAAVTTGEPTLLYWQTRLAERIEIIPVTEAGEGAPLDLANCVNDLGSFTGEAEGFAIPAADLVPADTDTDACLLEGGLVLTPTEDTSFIVRALTGEGRCDRRVGAGDLLHPQECDEYVNDVAVLDPAEATLTYGGVADTAAVAADTEATLDFTFVSVDDFEVGIYDAGTDEITACDEASEATAESVCVYELNEDGTAGTVDLMVSEATTVRLYAYNGAEDEQGDTVVDFAFTLAP